MPDFATRNTQAKKTSQHYNNSRAGLTMSIYLVGFHTTNLFIV